MLKRSGKIWCLSVFCLLVTSTALYADDPNDFTYTIDSGDYDGDGTSDIAIFRRSSTLWAIHGITRAYFGSSSDDPVPADYTGDGMDDIGFFRDSSGLWAIQDISRVYFGGSGDIPVTR